ncbi:MAG: hypothetical protein Q8O01_01015 [Candidatus Omnitrophota bacterium]|nr:hypothetical protein [Candidatus Omnitrophota bacterium]
MSMIKSNRGVALMVVLSLLVLFTAATVLYLNTTAAYFKITKTLTYSVKAFFLAESGINKTLYKLREIPGYTGGEGLCSELMPMGEYEVFVGPFVLDAGSLVNGKRAVRSIGYFPGKNMAGSAKKEITATISCPAGLPPWFYNSAIVAGEKVDLIGGSYTVTGSIKYGDSINPADTVNAQKFDEDFPILDFKQLRDVAISQVNAMGQNNLYTADDIANGKPFPTSFWFDKDEAVPQVPNVVYVETDLKVNGNIRIGGFFVVAGTVITDSAGANTIMDGKATIDGCVYTLGDFMINGGGSGMGVTGGVWSRDNVRLNGNAKASYNPEYMDAIKNNWILNLKPQVVFWKETYEF